LKTYIFLENNLDTSARFCPICKKKNKREAIICVHCGAYLETFSTNALPPNSLDLEVNRTEKVGELHFDESMIPFGGIAFYVGGTSKPIFSSFDSEFVIGRKVEETSENLLDLSRYGGYHLGISRRHATIRRTKSAYDVIDLASTNGTWLNDEQLVPNQPYSLVNGSQLRLARMRFFVLYRPVAETRAKA